MGAYSLEAWENWRKNFPGRVLKKDDIDTIDGQELEERGPVEALGGRDGEREKLGKGGN